jgi:hypothetical protein
VFTDRRVLGRVEDAVTVVYRVVPRSASPHDDFEVPLSGTVVLLPHEESKDLVIEVVGDSAPECDEFLYVRFELQNSSLLGSLIIEDDDRPRPVPSTGAPSGAPLPIDAPYVAPYTCKDGISIYAYPACMHEPELTGACPSQVVDTIFDAGSGTTTNPDGGPTNSGGWDAPPTAEVDAAADAGAPVGGTGSPDAAAPAANDGSTAAKPDTSAATPQEPASSKPAGCSYDAGRSASPASLSVLLVAATFIWCRRRAGRSARQETHR